MKCQRGQTVVLVAVVLGSTVHQAVGQSELPQTPIVVRKMRMPCLADILDKVVWNQQTSGPLLIVGAEKTGPTDWPRPRPGGNSVGPVSISPLPPPRSDGSYRLNDLGEYFGRRVVNVGTLTVYAPSEMTIFRHDKLPEVDPAAFLSPRDKLSWLETTLSRSQWEKLGSAEGIGASDLDSKQRVLFLSLLPDPLTVGPVNPEFKEARYNIQGQSQARSSGWQSSGVASNKTRTLTNEERSQVRLSLRRRLSWAFAETGKGGREVSVDLSSEPSPETPMFVLTSDRTFRAPDRSGPGEKVGIGYGIVIREEVPSKLKPGDLPFEWEALNGTVALNDVPTVGDLVERIRTQTGAELYCDPRYRSLTISARGTSARAGDVLKALCWAVTGTWRKVGDRAFVLTDDRVGLAVRQTQIKNWLERTGVAWTNLQKEIARKQDAVKPAEQVGWAADDPLKPSENLQKRIEQVLTSRASGQAIVVPVADLPAAAREYIQAQTAWWQERLQRSRTEPAQPSLRSDQVRLNLTLRGSLVLPGVGRIVYEEAERSRNDNVTSYLPGVANISGTSSIAAPNSAVLPSIAVRALVVTPRESDDLTQTVTQARQHGFTELWVAVPTGQEGATLTRKAVAAGKAQKLAVRAVVGVAREQKNVIEGVEPDRTLLGETQTEYAARLRVVYGDGPTTGMPDPTRLARLGEWLRCDDPQMRAKLRAAMEAVAQVDGLAGLILRDPAPPGYRGVIPMNDFIQRELQMGYTQPMRLAFLHRFGQDPLDLGVVNKYFTLPTGNEDGQMWRNRNEQGHLRLPFFLDEGPYPEGSEDGELSPKNKEGWAQWDQFRADTADTFSDELTNDLKFKHPHLSLFYWLFYGEDAQESLPFARCMSVETTPTKPAANRTQPLERRPARDEYRVFFFVPSVSKKEAQSPLAAIAEMTAKVSSMKENGIVLDMSAYSVEETGKLLEGIVPPQVEGAKPRRK